MPAIALGLASLALGQAGASARQARPGRHAESALHKARQEGGHAAPPAAEGSHFTLSGNVKTTIDNSSREQGCIGNSISIVEGDKKSEAEIASQGVARPGTFKLPDPEVVPLFAVIYPAADAHKGKYYSWTEPKGTITLVETAHGGVKGSLDLTLKPGYFSGEDSKYHNEATSAERIKGSWNCPLS